MTSNIENLSLKYEDIVGSKENVIGSTLISLINLEVGINVEGRQKLRGGWKIFMKSINVEGGIFLWRVEFFKIGKRGLHVY